MNPALPLLLHVEDDLGDKELLQHACRAAQAKINLHWVQDGEAAVEFLSGHGEFADRDRYPLPKLILLDLKMPRKSGLEVVAWLRGHPVLKGLPVVIFTASNNPGDVKRAFELGANSFVVKPHSIEELMVLVGQFKASWRETSGGGNGAGGPGGAAA